MQIIINNLNWIIPLTLLTIFLWIVWIGITIIIWLLENENKPTTLQAVVRMQWRYILGRHHRK
jgi:low temperature requirement protein LtrA